jgi:hypothetical protein
MSAKPSGLDAKQNVLDLVKDLRLESKWLNASQELSKCGEAAIEPVNKRAR